MTRSMARMAIAALRPGGKGSIYGSRAAILWGALLPGRPGAGSSGNQEDKRVVGGASPACFRLKRGHTCSSHD